MLINYEILQIVDGVREGDVERCCMYLIPKDYTFK